MTVNQITPESRHIISGVSGPYAITFPYTEGSIDVFAQRTGQRKVVPASGIILTPVSSPVGGQLYIGTEFAAAHVDWDLIIIRRTFDEQGWKGQANALEKQLEEQMDRQTMSIQELRRELRKTVRGSDVQDPLPPAGNGKILWWWNGKIVTGPSTDDLTGITNLARPLDDEGAEFGREDDTKIITRPDGVYIGDFRIMHLHFGSRALFEAATIPIWVKNWTVDYGGRHLAYRRDDTGTAIVSANGVKGSPMDPATPAHWGAAQAVDETTKLHAMISWCAANGHELNWPDKKHYIMRRYQAVGTDLNVNWTCTGTCKLESADVEPLGFGVPTGYEDDYFINFTGTTILTTELTETAPVGAKRIKVGSTAGVEAGKHIVLINTTKMIDTDHRGQNREGFQALVTRIVSGTQVEIEVPLDRQVSIGSTVGAVLAVNSATSLSTTIIGAPVSDMRYRVRFLTGAAAGQTAYVTDYDPTLGTINCHATNNSFPAGILAGDTFEIEREATVLFSAAVTGSITGNLEIVRPSTFNATPGDFGYRGLVLVRPLNFDVDGLRLNGFSEAGMQIKSGVRGRFANIDVQNANRAYDESDGTGYGVSVHQSSHGIYENIAGFGCRRTLDVSGTQATSWHNVTRNVSGSGGGTAYDGERFFPFGPTENSVLGSHGNGVNTIYENSHGTDIYTVLNGRGRDEIARGISGFGAMQQLVNLFHGGGIDLSGLTYDDRYSEIGKTTLTQNDATTHAEQRLSFVVQIDAGNWNEARPTVVRNIRAKGVRRGLFGLRGNGNIRNLTFSDYDVTVADNAVNFKKLRPVSGSSQIITQVNDRGGVIRRHDGYVIPEPEAVRSDVLNFPVKAYAPNVSRVAVDIGTGLYRHVPSIAIKDAGHIVGGYLFNDAEAGESEPGQRVGIIRSTNDGSTWSAKVAEFTDADFSENPLSPATEGNIQGEIHLAYDRSENLEIACLSHRGGSHNAGFINTRVAEPGAKWINRRLLFTTDTNAVVLHDDIAGAAPAGLKRTITIDGVEYELVPFKPVFGRGGEVVVPVIAVTTWAASHRVFMLVRENDVWSVRGRIPTGELSDGSAWEPTVWQAADGTWYCQVRNIASGAGATDNHALSASADLWGWSEFAFLDEDIHHSRYVKHSSEGAWIGCGTSHNANRNALSVFLSADGHQWVHGFTFGNETDATDFSHYSDIVVYNGKAYALYTEEEDQASSAAPNEVRFARFPLPTGLPLMGSRKNQFEIDGGTAPSVSGSELTIPPQMSGSLVTAGADCIVTIRARVSVAPNANPYTLASIGDAQGGYFKLEYRNNAGACELWAGGIFVRTIPAPLEYRNFQIAISMSDGIVTACGQSRALRRFGRLYLGDVEAGAAQAGNIIYDANGCNVAAYANGLPRQMLPELPPLQCGDVTARSDHSDVTVAADAAVGKIGSLRIRIGGSTKASLFYNDVAGKLYQQVLGANLYEMTSSLVKDLVARETGQLTVNGPLILGPGTTKVISAGAITITGSYHKVDTSGGASEVLNWIYGGVAGQILELTTASSLRDIIIANGGGNVFCGADINLNTISDVIRLRFNGTDWHRSGHADN